jgi:hypothetical protein
MNRVQQMEAIQQHAAELYQNDRDIYDRHVDNMSLHELFSCFASNIRDSVRMQGGDVITLSMNCSPEILNLLYGLHIYTALIIHKHKSVPLDVIRGDALELFKKKNSDYGDAFADFGIIGVLIRLNDKIRRVISINNSKSIKVQDESMLDTILDMYNYSAMAIMLW